MTKKPTRPAIGIAPPGRKALFYKPSEYPSLKRQEQLQEDPNVANAQEGGAGALNRELGPKYNYFGKREPTKKEKRLALEKTLAPVRKQQAKARAMVKAVKAKKGRK